MKRRLLALLILCSSFAAFGQISYEKDYNSALKQARTKKTPLFIFISVDGETLQSNYVSGITLPKVVSFYNKNFTSLRLPISSPAGREMASKYQINRYPYYLFLDTNENLIFKGFNNSMNAEFYLSLANEVLQRIEHKTSIFQLEQQYATGLRNKNFLKDYIDLRRKTGTTNNAILIEEYVKFLTIAELDNTEEILFILRAGPLVYGKAYGLAYSNSKLATDTFMALPLEERVDINEIIADNSLNEAIAKKSYQLAEQVSYFARNINTNYTEGERQASWKLLVYFKAVGDTVSYFDQAIRYNDRYFMSVSVDSVKRAKAENQKNIDLIKGFKNPLPKVVKVNPNTTGTKPPVLTTVITRVVISGSAYNVSNYLNTAAWDFYQTGTRNNNHLSKALIWSKRSIEMDSIPAYYDTLAHIFYRMGLFDEALLNQKKAIELSETKPEFKGGIDNLKSEMNKMKERTL